VSAVYLAIMKYILICFERIDITCSTTSPSNPFKTGNYDSGLCLLYH